MQETTISNLYSELPGKNNAYTFVRHGQTVANVQKICMGQLNTELTAKGISAAESVDLSRKPDAIYCSPLGRAALTARIIAKRWATASPVEDERLMERYGGDIEGMHYDDIYNTYGDILEPHEGDLHEVAANSFPNGESNLDVVRRLSAFILDRQGQFTGANILVVAHSGTIEAARYLWGGDFETVYRKPIGHCEPETYCL
jgi:broad specificity phosphatase PhoE